MNSAPATAVKRRMGFFLDSRWVRPGMDTDEMRPRSNPEHTRAMT
jgi:hypothetical protein